MWLSGRMHAYHAENTLPKNLWACALEPREGGSVSRLACGVCDGGPGRHRERQALQWDM